MTQPLRVLVVEDSEIDYQVLVATLRHDGFDVESRRVETAEAMAAALAGEAWDAVLSDHHMPMFDSFGALATLRASGRDLPFVVVSGEPGEAIAVDSVLKGADDYILKGSLKRLAPALRRALSAAETRRRRREAEQELKASEERLRELTLHMVQVKEYEWAATAREIHDEIGGSLTAIKFDLAWARARVTDSEVARRLDDALAVAEAALESSQRIMLNLRPGILEEGLVPALEWLARSFGERTGVEVRFESNRDRFACPPDLCMTVYRICQESLTNVTRHAQAAKVDVQLFVGGGELTLEVSDNGRGLKDGDLAKPSHFGVIGMRERARGHGGTLEVSGVEGLGTTVMLAVPFAEESAPA
ncbi:MAG TPA: response regulator [Usitatibacteraceae bacterium]|jgi:signal transduction histidine kinase|nr:response regulator [Usitatibacteraceae bacterium]